MKGFLNTMLTLNRMLVYTHKFDKWEYITLQDPNSTEYSTLSDLDSTQKKVLTYVSDTKQETTHYFQNGFYYNVVSTPNDLLQHIPYTPKDNRKHEMNRGFYEYSLPISDNDTVPLDVLSLALQLYIDGKSNCEVDISKFNALSQQSRQECIAKFLYISNELLKLNVYLKESSTTSVTPISNATVNFSIVKGIIDTTSVYLTYLNIFYFNTRSSDKISVENTSIVDNTLKYIFNTSNDTIRQHLDSIKVFLEQCRVPITIDNIWNYVENHSMQNSIATGKVLALQLSLNDMLSLIVNTKSVGSATFSKYLEVLNNTPVDSLQEFLNSTDNTTPLHTVHEKLSPIQDKPSTDVNLFISKLRSMEFTSENLSTLMELLKSMCLPNDTLATALSTVLTSHYEDILNSQNLLLSKTATLLDNISLILNFNYNDNSINATLRKFTEALYSQAVKKFMGVNAVSIDDTKKPNFMDKSILSLNVEDFQTLSGLFYKLFLVQNHSLDFTALTENEKVLILCTPELLLQYIDYCDPLNNDKLLPELFQHKGNLINIGMVQVQYIKYVLNTALEDTKTLPTTLTDLGLDLTTKKLKVHTKKLKKFLECIL